jgi:hypothetical protein
MEARITLEDEFENGSCDGSVRAISARRDEMKDSGDLWKDKDSDRGLDGIMKNFETGG